jgi:predicted NAD-dependent protein-ADP-ribosyltransferase YbiA (DUF1768 family)
MNPPNIAPSVSLAVNQATLATPLPMQTLVVGQAGLISFGVVKGPFGWLGNMAPFPVVHLGVSYRTTEALFQCLRFDGEPEIQEMIRSQASPMAAKWTAGDHAGRLRVPLRDAADLDRMRLCLRLKLEQHPTLPAILAATGASILVEDCTARPTDPEIDGGTVQHPFWGMARRAGLWQGNNALGCLWMELRGG